MTPDQVFEIIMKLIAAFMELLETICKLIV